MLKGPNYVCTVCHRRLYETSVSIIHVDQIAEAYSKLDKKEHFRRCIFIENHRRYSQGATYICCTCEGALKAGRMPAQAKANGLELDDIPTELRELTALERHLLTTRIIFMKLVNLPRGK